MPNRFSLSRIAASFALAALCIACIGSAKATDYTYQKIVGPDGETVYPAVLNNAGQIAGNYQNHSKYVHCFILTAGTYTTFDPPGSTIATVTAINSHGDVAGYFRGTTKQTHGFIYSNGAIQVIDYPGRYFTELSSINDAGIVSGESANKTRNKEGPSLLFTYDHGTFQEIDPIISPRSSAINNSGAVTATDAKGAFLYQNGVLTRIKPSRGVEAKGLNDNNQVVGARVSAPERIVGFVYSNHKLTNFHYKDFQYTSPSQINNSGTIVGYAEKNLNECCIAFSLSDGQFSLIQPLGNTDMASPVALNDSGQILVYDSSNDGDLFLATPAN